MALNHKVTRLIFAFSVGLAVAIASYQWLTDTERAARRAVEEAVVLEARQHLLGYVGDGKEVEISDALARVRAAGKVYVYPVADGWELSGHYKRADDRLWHAFLMRLDSGSRLVALAVDDDDRDLAKRASGDAKFSVSAGQ
jgi:hypothetical protein